MPLPAATTVRIGRGAALALVACAVVAAGGPAEAAPRAAVRPGYIGIVISGHGYACVRWTSGLTGDDVLNDVASVRYRSDGIILQIDGAPAAGKADADHYWSYWHDPGSSWQYSSSGASGYRPAAGSVEGWSYVNGSATSHPPAQSPGGLYASICGSRDAPQRSSPRPHSPAPSTRRSAGSHLTPSTAATGSRTSTSSTSGVGGNHTTATTTSPPASSTPASASASGATAAGIAGSPAALSLTPLPTGSAAAGRHPSGSALPVVVGLGLALLIGGGAATTMLRRRRVE